MNAWSELFSCVSCVSACIQLMRGTELLYNIPYMKKIKNRNKARIAFAAALLLIIGLYGISIWKTDNYNHAVHHDTFSGPPLFSSAVARGKDVSVNINARNDTWSKIFDFNEEGLTEENVQAFTYDFVISNNTKDEVSDFSFKLTFSKDVYLASAWNGSLEIHQFSSGSEVSDTVPDLRRFNPDRYSFEVFEADGESFIVMRSGDYLIYHPDTGVNAMEVPINPHEITSPGIIMYVDAGKDIRDSVLDLDYTLHRLLTSEPLFWVSVGCLLIWLIALIIFEITSAQIKKYTLRHERDNEIIRESIETFTGFIDAKDPYTNGHSNRVASYTRQIAKEMGFHGEELDRIYYTALLHDCGKIGVPDNILGKPGKLTNEEFEIIKSHTVRGGEILHSFKSLKDADEGALYHHERYDGKGYPEGKAGEEIPLIARMICVADSFDAMNTNRVYRNKLSKEQIIHEIETNKGKQFDPKIADIMLRLLKEGKISIDDKPAEPDSE